MVSWGEIGEPGDTHTNAILKYSAAAARPFRRIPSIESMVKGDASGSEYNTEQNIHRKLLVSLVFLFLMFFPSVRVRPGNIRRLGGPMAGPGGGRGRGMNLLR